MGLFGSSKPAAPAATAAPVPVAPVQTPLGRVVIGGKGIPPELETRGFLFAGAPGTGKSQAITKIVDSYHDGGQAVGIIADVSGIYLSRYGVREGKDVILNPFDKRGALWCPLVEIDHRSEITALVKSIIPDGTDSKSNEWQGYAQTLLHGILESVYEMKGGNQEIIYLSLYAGIKELQVLLNGKPANSFLQNGGDTMFFNVRNIVASHIQGLMYYDPSADMSNSFSIRRHLQGKNPGWIYITYEQGDRDSLKHMIAAQLDIAARSILNLVPNADRRVLFVIDELPLLGRVQSVLELLTNGRKYGSLTMIGIQTIAQLRNAYGRDNAQTLLSCLGTWLVLRCRDAETAKYMSEHFGEIEQVVISNSSSQTTGHSGTQGSSSSTTGQSEAIQVRKLVLGSQVQCLPDLSGYLDVSGPSPLMSVTIPIVKARSSACPGFIRKPDPAPPAPKPEMRPAEEPWAQSGEVAKENQDGGKSDGAFGFI